MRTLAILASFVAQEVKDRTYAHDKLRIALRVPEGWTIAKSEEEGTLCEFARGEDAGGQLDHEADVSATIEKKAEEQEKTFSSLDGVSDFKRLRLEKIRRSPGEWLLLEFVMTYERMHLRYACLFVLRDKHLFTLMAWCAADDWPNQKGPVTTILDSLGFTDGREHPWAAWAVGSWVEFRVTTGEVELTRKYTLVAKDDATLTFRIETRSEGKEFPPKETKDARRLFEDPPKETARGEEEIEVAGRKLTCAWVETGSATKTWTSDRVPGGLVKAVSREDGVETTTLLVAFEAKK